jgi:hypothetical protein
MLKHVITERYSRYFKIIGISEGIVRWSIKHLRLTSDQYSLNSTHATHAKTSITTQNQPSKYHLSAVISYLHPQQGA